MSLCKLSLDALQTLPRTHMDRIACHVYPDLKGQLGARLWVHHGISKSDIGIKSLQPTFGAFEEQTYKGCSGGGGA